MIELLASVVILGILMAVAVPTVMRVFNEQKNKMYIDDSKKLISSMNYKIRKDNMMPIPAVDSCIVVELSSFDISMFEDAPNEGVYDKTKSFVVAKRETPGYEFSFYVRLVEKTKAGGYVGVNFEGNDDLNAKDAKNSCVGAIPASKLFNLNKDYKHNLNYGGGLAERLNNEYSNTHHGRSLGCNRIIFYDSEGKSYFD